MKYNKVMYRFIVVLLLLIHVELKAQFWPVITKEAKPWTRWWWMGSAVNQQGLDDQLASLHNVGFGGVAIVPIYGAVGFESQYLKYLSPEWMRALDYTTAKASKLNMGVDMAVGTGWPIGGPQVSVADAATKCTISHFSIKENDSRPIQIIAKDKKGAIIENVKLEAVIAYDQQGVATDISANVGVDGIIPIHTLHGNWEVYAVFVGKTGQKVKRAAFGGEGYVLDHFSNTSVANYFKTFDSVLGNSHHGVRSFYNDSYEVFDANWTPSFFDVFKTRRGYDLKPHIKYLFEKSDDLITARVKSDYRETMHDLLLQNFTNKYTAWVHSKKAMNTNESHGSPGNILDIYAAVDIPEGEIFGSSHFNFSGIRRDSADIRNVDPDPIMLQFASSAAHVMGKPLVSLETFTWLTEHFKTSWSQCKPEVENAFLAGMNHVFYHGTTYSPKEVAWPGWLFYASVNFVPTNSLWPHIKGLNEYVTRCQSVLQAGTSDNEILAYWPIYDQWNKASGLDMPLKVHNIDEWLQPTSFYKNVQSLQAKGYLIDFASDTMLAQAQVKDGLLSVSNKGAKYKILFISNTAFMPLSTLQHIVALANDGATIIMQSLPKDMPGMLGLDKEQQNQFYNLIASIQPASNNTSISSTTIGKGRIVFSNDIQAGLDYIKVERETLVDEGLQFIRRAIPSGKYYYIVNHSANAVRKNIVFNTKSSVVYLLNPQTGQTGVTNATSSNHKTTVYLDLAPGEAIIVQTSNQPRKNKQVYPIIATSNKPIALQNQWTIHFSNGGPFLPSTKRITTLQPWTRIEGDTSVLSFSGTGSYTTHVSLSNKHADDYILTLEKVYESAKVIVNGKEAGLIWSVPYSLSIGKYLHTGDNEIKIEVNNLMANRIANMDRNKIEWRKYHEINFVNIDYKRFDASNWKVQASGLEGKVLITPVLYKKYKIMNTKL